MSALSSAASTFSRLASGGALTLINSRAPDLDRTSRHAMQISGSWLVDAFNISTTSVQMDAIAIDASTGAYTGPGGALPSQTFTVGTTPVVKQMVLSPDSANFFVALGTGGTIVVPFASGNANPLGTTATTIPLAIQAARHFPWRSIQALRHGCSTSARHAGSGFHGTSGGLPRVQLQLARQQPVDRGHRFWNCQRRCSIPTRFCPLRRAITSMSPTVRAPTSAGNVAWFPITASGTTYTVAAGKTVTSGIQPSGLAEDSTSNFVLAVSTGGTTTSGDPDLEELIR